MAVEARHLNLFPSHLLSTREMENATNMRMNTTGKAGLGGGLGVAPPTDSVLPFYNNYQTPNPLPPLKDDSGLTFSNSVAGALQFPRKRPRETINDFNNSLSFLGEDLSLQMMQHQLEADRLISLHMEKVRLEMEERGRRQSRRVIGAIDEAIAKRLREKEEQMERIAKQNHALEERVKSLFVENQIWRDLAQANEAAAISLQSSLDQLLAQANNCEEPVGVENGDAESCCGSNGGEASSERRMCRVCGGRESSVLVLPCRHLCLCTACGPAVDTCPVCNSTNNATLLVHFS